MQRPIAGQKPIFSSPHLARAGALMVRANNAIYYVGGELKPGVRSAEVQNYLGINELEGKEQCCCKMMARSVHL